MRNTTIIIVVLLLLSNFIFAEGTKQIIPIASDSARGIIVISKGIQGGNEYGYFAVPEANADNRLWFTISNVGEKVYYGFKKVNASKTISYVIKNAAGVVQTGTSGNIPTSGNGYISSYNRAILGPAAIVTGGYNALTFTPSATGNYYIEFDYSTGFPAADEKLRYLDITITSASNVVINGRVWSKNWYLSTEGGTGYLYRGKMFAYSDDQIVTQIDFNGMGPYFFRVACNPTGCANTGNFNLDRRSRSGNHTYEKYKIFLNNPDINTFPTGILGQVLSVTSSNDCDGTLDINMWVNKSGNVDILLNINPLPGYQAEDVVLSDSVYEEMQNTITWNGLNGLGVQVANGTTFNIVVTYINGLTNLPMYDVEYNPIGWTGFKIDLIRPAGVKPKVYWDDSQIPGGTINFDGCDNVAGCHPWPPGTGASSYGDVKTINTWWYSLSTTMAPITLTYRISHYFESNHTMCFGDSVLAFGQWQFTTGTYYDSLLNLMGCDSVYALHLTVNPIPPVNLGPDSTICTGEFLTLDAGYNPNWEYQWNTGANSHSINVTSSGIYSVTVDNEFGCNNTDAVEVFVAPLPPPALIRHN